MQMRLSAKWLCGLTCMAGLWFLVMFLYLNDLFADEVRGQRGHEDSTRNLRTSHRYSNASTGFNAERKHSLDLFALNIARPPNILVPQQYAKDHPILPDQDDLQSRHLKISGKKTPRKGHRARKTKPRSPYIKNNNYKQQLQNLESVTYKKLGAGNASVKVKDSGVMVPVNGHRVAMESTRIQAPFKQRGVMVYLGYSESRDLRLDLANGMDRHSFNVTLSHHLPLNRAIPDYRPAGCLKRTPEVTGLPSVSVIICFHNEALSTLLRTAWSVLHHSPASVLEDVILVDDNSTFDYLRGELESYLQHWPKVRLVRTHQREGLVRARLLGVSHARGDVLVFLDSHCECNSDWLPPLLRAVQLQPTKVVVPELDIIDPDTLAYTAAPGHLHGSFDWNLKYVWKTLPWNVQVNASHLPIRSPTMIGGVFAIARQFFQHLGGYDPGLEIWGGENLQLSFKVWQCGGSIQVLPCSRVGHLFRRVMPYGFPQGGKATIQRNAVRVAEVWLDEYRMFFYASQNVSRKDFGLLSLGRQHAVRQRLQCRDFHWYLTQIIPELPLPANNTEYYGQIQSAAGRLCLHSLEGSVVLVVAVRECLTQHPAQMFQLSVTGGLSQHYNCVSTTGRNTVLMRPCHLVTQRWTHTQNGQLSTVGAKGEPVCMGLNSDHSKLVLQACGSQNKPSQHMSQRKQQQQQRKQWSFTHHFDQHHMTL